MTANTPPRFKLVKRERFDIFAAQKEVWYELHQADRTFFRRRLVYRRVTLYHPDYDRPVTGDKEWAERIASHYAIEVPE